MDLNFENLVIQDLTLLHLMPKLDIKFLNLLKIDLKIS